MAEDTYRAIDAVNHSTLARGERSMLHLQHAMLHPMQQTKAMRLGTIVHACVLEGVEFKARYTVMPDLTEGITTKAGEPAKNPRSTAEYRRRLAEWHEEHDGLEVIEPQEHEVAIGIHDAIDRHPSAAAIITAREHELVAVSDLSGVLCKCRADAVGNEVLYDLKTTTDASPDAFAATAARRGYWRQMAFYMDLLRAAGRDVEHAVIVAAEVDPPHAVAVYRLTEEQLGIGRADYQRLLADLVTAISSGRFDGYHQQIRDLPTPAWAVRDRDHAIHAIPSMDEVFGGAA